MTYILPLNYSSCLLNFVSIGEFIREISTKKEEIRRSMYRMKKKRKREMNECTYTQHDSRV